MSVPSSDFSIRHSALNLRSKTVLITGAAGFIGRRMTAAALAANWHVIGLDREVLRAAKPEDAAAPPPGEGRPDTGERRTDGGTDTWSAPTRYSLPATHSPVWLTADITSDAPIELPPGLDAIIHLAGKAHALAEVAQDEAEYFQINTEGTRRMLEAAKAAGVKSFVLFSTVKAAGEAPTEVAGSEERVASRGASAEHGGRSLLAGEKAGEGLAERETSVQPARPADESVDSPPDTPYGQSKRAAEKLVLEGGYIPHPVVLRPCLVYGPTPKGNLEKMIAAVRRGRFPPLPEVGNKRSMVHIDDVIAAALLAAEHPAAAGQVYIVADNEPFSTRQLFEWICTAAGRRIPRWTMPLWLLRLLGRVGDGIGRLRGRRFVFDSDALAKLTGSAWYTSAKLQRELGWTPQHTLQETMGEMVGGFARRET